MPGDPLAGAESLLADLARWQRRAERAGTRAGTATASSGPVAVEVHQDGRLTRITIRAGWRRQIGVDELSETVRDAVRSASASRLQGWATAFGDDEDEPGLPPGGTPLPSDGPAQRLQRALAAAAPGDLRAAIAQLTALVRELCAGVTQAQDRLQTAAAATYTGRAGDGKVVVSLTAGAWRRSATSRRGWRERTRPRSAATRSRRSPKLTGTRSRHSTRPSPVRASARCIRR